MRSNSHNTNNTKSAKSGGGGGYDNNNDNNGFNDFNQIERQMNSALNAFQRAVEFNGKDERALQYIELLSFFQKLYFYSTTSTSTIIEDIQTKNKNEGLENDDYDDDDDDDNDNGINFNKESPKFKQKPFSVNPGNIARLPINQKCAELIFQVRVKDPYPNSNSNSTSSSAILDSSVDDSTTTNNNNTTTTNNQDKEERLQWCVCEGGEDMDEVVETFCMKYGIGKGICEYVNIWGLWCIAVEMLRDKQAGRLCCG